MTHPGWPIFLRILLALHIAWGAIAFVCAPVALITVKGGKTHRRWGKIYFWAMAVVAVTAVTLSLLLPIFFLAMAAVFSFYAAFHAYRILFLKDLYKGGRPQAVDWTAAGITVATSFVLFLSGFLFPLRMGVGVIHVTGHAISIVSVVFGFIGMRMGVGSLLSFLKPSRDKMFWWFDHMQGMIASYIAAMTAFSAVNLSRWFGAAWWVWLWPTMLGVPMFFLWTRYCKRKFAPKTSAKAA